MRYYANDSHGNDIFYVEIFDIPYVKYEVESADIMFDFIDEENIDISLFLQCSLPNQVLLQEDVYAQAILICKVILKGNKIVVEEIDRLVYLVLNSRQFTFYYFQYMELDSSGKYDELKATVIYSCLEKNGIEIETPYSMRLTPYEFRYIIMNLNLFSIMDQVELISKSEFEFALSHNPLLVDDYLELINEKNLFKRLDVQFDGKDAGLYFIQLGQNLQLLFIKYKIGLI
jgi:hypothetical protein